MSVEEIIKAVKRLDAGERRILLRRLGLRRATSTKRLKAPNPADLRRDTRALLAAAERVRRTGGGRRSTGITREIGEAIARDKFSDE